MPPADVCPCPLDWIWPQRQLHSPIICSLFVWEHLLLLMMFPSLFVSIMIMIMMIIFAHPRPTNKCRCQRRLLTFLTRLQIGPHTTQPLYSRISEAFEGWSSSHFPSFFATSALNLTRPPFCNDREFPKCQNISQILWQKWSKISLKHF